MEKIFEIVAGNGLIGAVLAIALWQWCKLSNKAIDVIEKNATAMSRLSEIIEQFLKTK